MRINEEKCIGCGICVPYCPAFSIKLDKENMKAIIDEDSCFECGNCSRARVVRCPVQAFEETPEIKDTTRRIRRFFSDPSTADPVTKVPGRGTEEVKTNDVTGRVIRGKIGLGIEVGRPCLGTDLNQVEKITTALAPLGIEFEEMNPLTHLMEDRKKGTIQTKYKDEKVISCIIEFSIQESELVPVINVLKSVADQLDTVFSLDMIYRLDENGELPILPKLKELGIRVRKNSKVNLGMGRPLVME